MSNGNGTKVIEARIRNDRKTFSRHYTNVTPEQARKKAQRLGHVISVRKVDLWGVIGTMDRIDFSDIVVAERDNEKGARRSKIANDMILDNMGLEDIVFGKKKPMGERRRK